MDQGYKLVDGFDNYGVCPDGRVFSIKTGKTLSPSYNKQGILKVSLYRRGGPTSLSVAKMVATAYLPPPLHRTFDTPIHLDGDKSNVHVSNLAWRPLWFAVRFHAQFKEDEFVNGRRYPLKDIESGEKYLSIYEVCTTLGVVYTDVAASYISKRPVWPIDRIFGPVR